MRDLKKILDITNGFLLITVLMMAWLLIWCNLNPDQALAADNWKSIVTGGLVTDEAGPENGHPVVNGAVVIESTDSGCIRCHNSLP